MTKLNRIGNKLGLAGAVGVLLSVGMVANQMATESSVNVANQRAETQQGVAYNALIAQVALREMMLAARGIRLAKTPTEVENSATALSKARVAEENGVDAAMERAVNPANRERLHKIKSLMGDYYAGAEAIAKAQLDLLAQTDKRSAISAEWSRAFAAQLTLPALAKLDSRNEIEKLLHQANASVNLLCAAAWHFGASGEEEQHGSSSPKIPLS